MAKFKKQKIEQELEMKPFINFMITLVPVLIMSVEFAKISIIEMKLPEGRGSQTTSAQTEQSPEDVSNKLLLTAIITDSVVTLGAKGGFLPSLFYREYHKYSARDDFEEFTVEYTPGKPVKHPKSGRDMTVYERQELFLYLCDENRNLIEGMYTQAGEMLTDVEGIPKASVNAGDTVYALTEPRMMIVVKNPADFKKKPISAYDELRNRLMKVKSRFTTAEDGDEIIIAAENEVLYDKIVQIMDSARLAGFPGISIAKLRA